MNETTQCPYCGETIMFGAKKCKHCGEWLDNSPKETTSSPSMIPPLLNKPRPQPINQNIKQPIIVNTSVVQPRSNGIGTAGFVFALLSILFSWAPGVNFIIWFLGLLFSFIGLFRRPRGLATVGFILSIIGIIIIIALIGAIGAFLSDIF